MSEARFVGTGADRRRRMLATDVELSDAVDMTASESVGSMSEDCATAFPLLSRDQVMRKIISPRLWKHNVVACLLVALPFVLAGFQFPGQDKKTTIQTVSAVRGICGLELFVASQLCLLICWVRAASAVDFAGVFRAWRWMSAMLLISSLFMLTGLASSFTGLLASWLQPLMGQLEASRPALLFVPLFGLGVYVLRHVIPDMGRCRLAQTLIATAALLLVARLIWEVRGWSSSQPSVTAFLDLLICGLALSSVQLHCRYVIYVNPNPPVAGNEAKRNMIVRSDFDQPSSSNGADDAAVDDDMESVIAMPVAAQPATQEAIAVVEKAGRKSSDEQKSATPAKTARAKSEKKSQRRAG